MVLYFHINYPDLKGYFTSAVEFTSPNINRSYSLAGSFQARHHKARGLVLARLKYREENQAITICGGS